MKTTHNDSIRKKKVMVFLLMLCAIVVFSQNDKKSTNAEAPSGKAFDGTKGILNIGAGFGGARYYSYGNSNGNVYRQSPAFSVSYEHPIAKKLGPGYLGVGGYFGFQRLTHRYNNYFYGNNQYYYKQTWNYWMLAARAAYHADALNWDKGEIYFGLMGGLRFHSYKFASNSPDPDVNRIYGYQGNNGHFAYSFFAGGRYYLSDQVALFGELGYGISYLTLGVSLKL